MPSIIRDASHLAAVLKAARKHSNLTQAQLGAKVGLVQKKVSHLEVHMEKSSVEALMKQIKALGLVMVIQSEQEFAASQPTNKATW
jgi:HTH-type transcriptional regulator/antitoxin HipB